MSRDEKHNPLCLLPTTLRTAPPTRHIRDPSAHQDGRMTGPTGGHHTPRRDTTG
jgi:hypothetical protein